MTLDVTDRLSAMDDAFQEAPTESGYELPPDGTYQAVVEHFDWFEASKTSGHLFLKTELRITNGQHEGAPVETVHDVEDPERLGWLKGHLGILGLSDVEPFSTLEQRLEEVMNVAVEIRIKTSTKTNAEGVPYRNVYVNKRLGNGLAVAGAPAKKKNPDDDIPF